MKAILLILFILVLMSINCLSPSRKIKSDCSDLIKIEIVNKTTNQRIKKDTVLTNTTDINDLQKQLIKNIEVTNVIVSSNFGYYDLILYNSKGMKNEFSVIYTVYSGIVIDELNTNRKFKNDALESLILNKLSN